MPGIMLTIEVDDKGTVKVKQFSDETKKAFDQMKKAPQEAAESLNSLRDSWVGVIAKTGIAATAFYAAKRAVFDMAPAIASAGNEIERMSRNFNMSTDDFQKWSYVAKMADIDAQGLGMALQFLTRSMGEALQGSGDASKAFSILGINLKDTTRKTKDQQTVLMDTIGALEKYADGVNRDALTLAIFGRSWMSIKPLIDQGTKAIEENKKEAERLSLILGKDVIKSLSESENAFKQWSMTWKVARMEIFEPFVSILGSMLERIMALKRAWAEGGIKGVYQDILAAQEEARIQALPPAAWTKEWVAGWMPPKITKPEAPAIPGAPAKEVDTIKEVLAAIEAVTAAEELRGQIFLAQRELVESGWDKEKDIVEQVREELANLERETNEWGEVTVARQELVEEGWKKISEIQKIWTSLSENISSAWSSGMINILKSTENASTKLKSFFQGIGDVFLSTVSKMITQWLLFGSITGKTEKGGGWWTGGSWTGILGSIFESFQQGGIIKNPTFGLIGEGGPEAVVPLKSGKIPIEGKSGGDTYIINNINAIDTKTFEEYVRQNPGAILTVVNQNARSAGAMKNIIRGT